MAAKSPPMLIGTVFGRLTVTGEAERRDKYLFVPVCCTCGVIKVVEQNNLRKGKVTSCGCYNKELVKARSMTHGMRDRPIYAVWAAMVQRCTNTNSRQYPDYGGRGITVEEAWLAFEQFYASMGDAPFEGAMLERIDNSKGYSKANCKWASRTEQNNNKRNNVFFTYKGEEHSLEGLANIAGINKATIASRIYLYKWSVEEAVETPVNN